MDIIDKDIKIAHTMEGDFYHLEKYFELSKEKIFAKYWQLISDESNLGSCIFGIDLLDIPSFLV